jgi:hypothetical protein
VAYRWFAVPRNLFHLNVTGVVYCYDELDLRWVVTARSVDEKNTRADIAGKGTAGICD